MTSRSLLLLELARTEAALLQAASTDAVKRALLAARVRWIGMRLGLSVPTGNLQGELDEGAALPIGQRKPPAGGRG